MFAPSREVRVGTYSMKEAAERELYELGIQDFQSRLEELKRFLNL